MPGRTRNCRHRDSQSTGGPFRRKRTILQEDEEGWPSRLSDSAPRPRGHTRRCRGCEKGSSKQWGLGKLESGLKGVMQPVVATLKFSAYVATSSGFTCALS